MEKYFFIALAVVAIAFLFDALRQSSKKQRNNSANTNSAGTEAPRNIPLSADEALPTQTGKFRVQQMFDNPDGSTSAALKAVREEQGSHSTIALKDLQKNTGVVGVDDDETPLPDPFENK